MSVVAGCSLFNGVMLVADCRMTIQRKGEKDIYVDNVQKLFPLSPTTAIGFVGNIQIASQMLKSLLNQFKRKTSFGRVDPISLLRWFPRYLRYKYAHIAKSGLQLDIAIMVASVVQNRPNLIERSKVVEIMEIFRLGKSPMKRSWLPNILVEILKTPSATQVIQLVGAPLGLLYFMTSPQFAPQFLKPLEFAAIGSGEAVVVEINKYYDWIFAGDVGNPFMESMALRETVSSFINKQGIESVGGLYPCLKIDAKGITFIGEGSEIPVGGTRIELLNTQNGRWIQKNATTGKVIKLLYPWEIDFSKHFTNQKFDDLKEAYNAFKTEKVD